MIYPVPSSEELKEFYLCGIRTGFAHKKAIPTLTPENRQLKAYDCDYCGSWHRIPENQNEIELLTEAEIKFISHIEGIFGTQNQENPRIEVPTSSVIILGVN